MIAGIKECKSILIIKLSSIGDVVMTTSVAETLRREYPSAHIAWIVEEKSKDALIGNPFIDEVIVWRRSAGKRRGLSKYIRFIPSLYELGNELKKHNFDIAIDFQGLLRSALVGVASGAKYRIGSDDAGECATLFYNKHAYMPERMPENARRHVTLLELIRVFSENSRMFFPVSDSDRLFARGFLAEEDRPGTKYAGFVGMCPATTWAQKHWTEEGWAALADRLAAEYSLLPVFLGSKADQALILRIMSKMERRAANAAGNTTLNQAGAIMEQCSVVFAVDTGLLHISMALDRPTVGIFGPTYWSHFTKHDNFVPVRSTRECMPCLRHPTCEKFDCMTELSADDVLLAAESMLSSYVINHA